MDDKGIFFGTNTNDCVKVFGMEHWWGNIWRRQAGYVTDGSGLQKTKLTWGKQDGSTVIGYNTDGSGYVTIPNSNGTGSSGGYINTSIVNERGWFPKNASGSASTYECDGFWFVANCYAYVGGSCGDGSRCGAWSVGLNAAVSLADWSIGASISCKPVQPS